MEFSGAIFDIDMPISQYCHGAVYKTTRETTLCTRIAAKQPLALALAKRVKTCHFTNCQWYQWSGPGELYDRGKLLTNKYLAEMSRMRNMRELAFFRSFVGAEHWDVIATLPFLKGWGSTHAGGFRGTLMASDLRRESGPSRLAFGLFIANLADPSGR